MKNNSLYKKLKGYFITGIAVTAPALVTIAVFIFFFNKIDSFLGGIFTNLIGFRIPGLGLLAFVFIIIVAGFLTRLYLGKKFLELMDKILTGLPFAKTVYVAVKQLRDFVRIRKKLLFKEPLIVPFPQRDSYCIGFLTSETRVGDEDEKYLGVFVPTTPNPTSGYLIFFRETQVKKMNLSVEEAMKVVISGGIMAPDNLSYTESIGHEKLDIT